MLIPSRALTLAALLAVASTTPRADVLVVDAAGGPGSQYTDLQPAVDAAQPGDTLLVRSGTYSQFDLIGKGLSIVADQGANVTVVGRSAIQSVPASTAVLVSGLSFEEGGAFVPKDGVLVVDGCVGGVWLEDCSVISKDPVTGPAQLASNALLVKASVQVIIVRSTVEGHPLSFANNSPTPGIKSKDSGLTIVDSSVRSFGALNQYDSAVGAAALEVGRGQVYAEGSTFHGGPGSNGFYLFGCIAGKDGGDAVFVGGGASFFGKRNTYIPGSAGASVCGGTPAKPGVDVKTVGAGQHVELPGLVRYFQASSPVRELDPFSLAFDVEPFEDVFLLLGSEPLGLFLQPLGGSLLVWGNLQILSVGQANGAGTLDLVLPMPPLPPGALSQDFYLQAAVLNSAGLGLLGGGSAVTVLDASL